MTNYNEQDYQRNLKILADAPSNAVYAHNEKIFMDADFNQLNRFGKKLMFGYRNIPFHLLEDIRYLTAMYQRGQWISVDERLPEKADVYLIYPNGQYSESHYSKHLNKFAVEHLYGIKITHWMPRPQAPKEQSND